MEEKELSVFDVEATLVFKSKMVGFGENEVKALFLSFLNGKFELDMARGTLDVIDVKAEVDEDETDSFKHSNPDTAE